MSSELVINNPSFTVPAIIADAGDHPDEFLRCPVLH